MEDFIYHHFPDDENFHQHWEENGDFPLDDVYIAQIESTLGQPIAQLMTYSVDLQELAEYVCSSKTVCECSYELQICIFDLFPRWYIAQTSLRSEIYPDVYIPGTKRETIDCAPKMDRTP